MKITIKSNYPEVMKTIKGLPHQIRDKVVAVSLNKTIEQGRNQAVREITKVYAVKAAFVKERLRIRKTTAAQGMLGMRVELMGGNGVQRAANIVNFSARQLKDGVSVSIKKGEGRKLIRNAFIANKGRTVFTRVPDKTMASRAKYKGTKHAHAIRPVQTIDVPAMFTSKVVNNAIRDHLQQKFPEVFAHQAKFFTDRFNTHGF